LDTPAIPSNDSDDEFETEDWENDDEMIALLNELASNTANNLTSTSVAASSDVPIVQQASTTVPPPPSAATNETL
jgi:hypothetical protein